MNKCRLNCDTSVLIGSMKFYCAINKVVHEVQNKIVSNFPNATYVADPFIFKKLFLVFFFPLAVLVIKTLRSKIIWLRL